MNSGLRKPAVYFDGSCPLCEAEIGYYRRKDHSGTLCFIDVSGTGAQTPAGVTRQEAMERFHVQTGDGRVVSGAAAFIEVWRHLPGWRWLARAASFPGAIFVLERCYRMFLPVRPLVARLVRRIRSPSAARGRGRGVK